MKKSSTIKLVLITALLASCNSHKHRPQDDVYMRSDSTAEYYPVHSNMMWYYAFRPYGMYYGGGSYYPIGYMHAGYYSEAIPESSNIGSSGFKGGIVRGGFGGSHGFSVSS
jgi:hypothetical protein